MLKYNKEKSIALKEREQHLKVMKKCLEFYKETGNNDVLEFVKWLGTVTQKIKKDIDDGDLEKYKNSPLMDRIEEEIKERNENLQWEIDYITKFPKLYFEFSRKDLYDEDYFFVRHFQKYPVYKTETYLMNWLNKNKVFQQNNSIYDGDKLVKAKQYPITNLLSFSPSGFTCCPFHNERTPSMKYYQDKNTVHCFGCRKTADAIDVYMQLYNVEFKEALDKLN